MSRPVSMAVLAWKLGLIPVRIQRAILERFEHGSVLKRSKSARSTSSSRFPESKRLGGARS